MSLLSGLFGTILPHMWSEHLSARSKNDVSTSVMCHKLSSSLIVDLHVNLFVLELGNILLDFFVKNV